MKIAIVGGGPAGCAAAYTLSKQGCEVHLFEAQDGVGGRTRQLRKDGFNLGSGALFLMGGIYPRTNALLKELSRYDELVPWGAKTHVIDADGKKHQVDFDQVMSFLKLPVFSLGEKLGIAWGVLKELVKPGPKSCFDGAELAKYDEQDVTLEAWSKKVLGEKGTTYITYPYMGFLYAVPLHWLSMALFKAIVQQFYKLALRVPPGSMGQISEWLIEGSPNAEVHLSTPVERIVQRASGFQVIAGGAAYDVDKIILSCEPGVTAALLSGLIPDGAKTTLEDCPYSEYAHVQLCYEQNPWPNSAVSVALPATKLRSWGACVLQSRRHPNATPPGGEAVGVYFYTPPLGNMSDEEVKAEACKAAGEAFGPAPPPDHIELFRYRRGLSIAPPGHYRRMDDLHEQMPDGICLAGDYFAHAGVEAAILSGERAATRLLS